MSKKRRSKRTTTGNNADLCKKDIDLYLYKSDVEGAEKWFQKADETGFLLAPAACYYGRLLSIERNDREKSKKCFKKSAEEGYDEAYAEYASILHLRDHDLDQAEMYFKLAEENDCLTPSHAYNYGELLVRERNEIERGNRYMDLAEKDMD